MVNKNIIITAVGVIGVAVLAFILRPTIIVQPTPVQVVTQPETPTPVSNNFGALSSPDIANPYLAWGSGTGERTWRYGADFATGTSTLCSFPLPFATTTISLASAFPNISTSSAVQISLSTSTNSSAVLLNNGIATTTMLGNTLVAANTTNGFYARQIGNNLVTPVANGQYLAATSTDLNSLILSPSKGATTTYLRFIAQGGAGAGTVGSGNVWDGGRCKVILNEI